VNIEPTGDRRAKRTAYRASVGRKDCPGGLAEQLAMLPTAQARDWKGASGRAYKGECQDLRQVLADGKNNGQTLRLEPAFVEWMMGFPLNWTSLEAETTEFPDLNHSGTP